MDLASCSLPPFIYDDCLEPWKLIGSGGFGKIYKAKHKKWGMDVAIKLLHSTDGSNSSLLQEADLMRHGGNPNVLRILGVYKSQDQKDKSAFQMGLVMEYMERGSLMDLQLALKECPPWPLAFRIINQIALGMNFLHQLDPPLLHLDLKPSNVLLDDSLNAKLTDFGLAKISKSTSKSIEENDRDAAGTTSYMPPEAFHSTQYLPDFASDVYSYGILVWSVVTGKQPYLDNFSSLVRFRVREGDRPDTSCIEKSQADGLSRIIDLMQKCWDHNSKIRPTFIDCIEITNNVYEMHKQHVPDAVHTILKKLRQFSIPSNVSICLSNVTGVQIGDNNYMNVQGTRQRQRHPTAPSVTQPSSKQQQKPPQ
ncbi:receptor-interacting serine/threonine-protein kinase 3 [Silurus asotus]|uniref:Receptor-interacting serine/threonine-protein kinase 3 n=1 Tax=Silurus asotus TaxID=30991 RepID=A0AAD5AL19_SILAS|nr:receptor-interacting serine/threonine-protein kinase 3 [Silurus asotus]